MNVIIQPSARADVMSQFRWYLEQGIPDVAERFLIAFNQAVESIIAFPHAGAPRCLQNKYLAGLRLWPVNGFKELNIYYIAQDKNLIIVRVLHDKRDALAVLEDEESDPQDVKESHS